MIDLVTLTIKAGNGGNGKISFHREKYVLKGGPDGGQGGDGGSVILVGTDSFNTLKHYAGKKEILAPAGERGGRRKKTGSKGEDLVIEVPVGTHVWLVAENEASAKRRAKYSPEHTLTRGEIDSEIYRVQKETESAEPRAEDAPQPLNTREKLVEINAIGQRVVLCQGGFGGRGNVAFKSSIKTTPLEAEYGTPGEQKQIVFELKLLADVGLVGYPNAGKSTLLSKLTRAHPKTADYPFTTLEPNLGVLNLPGGRDLIMADIPGLIEGASQGKGLGLDFLRHIENSRILVFVLFLDENLVSDANLTDLAKAETVWQQYQHLRQELKAYQPTMLDKPSLVSLNKIDLYSPSLLKAIQQRLVKAKVEIFPFSAFTGAGLSDLTQQIARTID